jgi:hypothetical protein
METYLRALTLSCMSVRIFWLKHKLLDRVGGQPCLCQTSCVVPKRMGKVRTRGKRGTKTKKHLNTLAACGRVLKEKLSEMNMTQELQQPAQLTYPPQVMPPPQLQLTSSSGSQEGVGNQWLLPTEPNPELELEILERKVWYTTNPNRLSAVSSGIRASSGAPSRASTPRREGSRTPPGSLAMSPGTDERDRIIDEQRRQMQQLEEMLAQQLPQQQAVARGHQELLMKEELLKTAATRICQQGRTVADATVELQQRDAQQSAHLAVARQQAEAEVHKAGLEAQENIAREERAAQESLQRQRALVEAQLQQKQRAAEEEAQRKQSELELRAQQHQAQMRDLDAGRAQSVENAQRECERIRMTAAAELQAARQQTAEAQASARDATLRAQQEQRMREQAECDHQVALRMAQLDYEAEHKVREAQNIRVSSEPTSKSSPMEYSISSPSPSVERADTPAPVVDPEKEEMRRMLLELREEMRQMRSLRTPTRLPSVEEEGRAEATPGISEQFELDSSDEENQSFVKCLQAASTIWPRWVYSRR